MRASLRPRVRNFKTVVLGNAGVGKCSLIHTFLTINTTDHKTGFVPPPTVGVDYLPLMVRSSDGQSEAKLVLWDTAGSEKFRALIPAYVRDAQAVLCVFDLTNRVSFDAISEWVAFVEANAASTVHLHLIGNKCDTEIVPVVTDQEIAHLQSTLKFRSFTKVSAITGEGVAAIFAQIAEEALTSHEHAAVQIHSRVKLAKEPKATHHIQSACAC